MALFYKPFERRRTALCAVFLLFLCAAAVAQANTLFTVTDVQVDVTAKSAVEARQQAFDEAQLKAFDVLAERMLPADQKETFKAPDAATVSTMIMDYEVTKERLSNVRYVGTYKFRFKESSVKKFFSQSGVSYTDVISKQLLILPFYEHQQKQMLWSPFNIWMQAWNRVENQSALVPVAVPLGDLSDVKDIGDNEALSYDPARLEDLLARYDAGEAVLAIATPDTALAMVGKGSAPADGRLQVRIYRTDNRTPQLVQNIAVEPRDGETRDALMDRAVAEVQKILRQDWKSKTAASALQANKLQVRVPIRNFQQWSDTQRVLRQVPGVEDVVLKSLSPRQAVVDLMFQGDDQRLRLALRQADIVLQAPGDGEYGASGQYQLYLSRYAPNASTGGAGNVSGDGFYHRF